MDYEFCEGGSILTTAATTVSTFLCVGKAEVEVMRSKD